ncbi:hypothetical protein ACTVKR_23900 [Serratia bockelmannii]|uniref:hypothetical protein n=1 Tax=Serratia bockelmannii TaxID=2703793 RepID=UPI003FA69E56
MAEPVKISLTTLKEAFDAWRVPSDRDFAQLIDVAALSFQPGHGLTGGDPSSQANVVAVGQVKPISVKLNANGAMELSSDGGIGIRVAKTGGLNWGEGGKLRVMAGDNSIDCTAKLGLKATGGLTINGALLLALDKESGLSCSNLDKKLSLEVDKKAVIIDGNILKVKCRPGGGLNITEGYLDIDIQAILAMKSSGS